MPLSDNIAEQVVANIKTFIRPKKFRTCLECVVNAGVKYIIVGYDGFDSLYEEHLQICHEFDDNAQITFKRYPFNFGLANVRNAMYNEANKPFILQVDDDNYIPSNTLEVVPFLEKHPEIGGVGLGWIYTQDEKPTITMDAVDLEIVGNCLLKTMKNPKNAERMGSLYFVYPFEYIPNIAIFRRGMFEEIQWDNNYIIGGEHVDFYLNLKNRTKWQMAICLSTYAIHDFGPDKDREKEEYIAFRAGKNWQASEDRFAKKWGISKKRHCAKRMFFSNIDYDEIAREKEKQEREEISRNEY
ncbi:MAG: glycosyltransferase family 2 protein [Candidatus Heimdallarchaeota archaeon]|nr:glycosyltransferase family 2 protein [Candidatus Heimdallarchaeota archaeon]